MTDEVLAPRYLQAFQCLGSECPETCCQGWRVPVDRVTYEGWQRVSVESLRRTLHETVRRLEPAEGPSDEMVAEMVRRPSGECAALTPDKLCSIHARFGEDAISERCRSYPRMLLRAGEQTSMFASLGCHETARLVLSDPDAMTMLSTHDLSHTRTRDVLARKALGDGSAAAFDDAALDPVEAHAERLAEAARALIGRPELNVRQGWAVFTQGLLEIVAASRVARSRREAFDAAAQVLAGLQKAVPPDDARAAEIEYLAQFPLAERFEIAHKTAVAVASLPGQAASRGVLRQALAAFGVGDDGPVPVLPAATGAFEQAERDWYGPFERAHPHLLKNVLLNQLGVSNFPLHGLQRVFTDVAEFSLRLEVLRLFLVGRALERRQRFAIEDCVAVVHAFSRYVPR